MARWELYDPATLDTYDFEVNPAEGGTPSVEKNFSDVAPAAEDGAAIVFAGRPAVVRVEISGRLISQDQLDELTSWAEIPNQVRITDDLGRASWVLIENFTATRLRRVSHIWTHDWTMSYLRLGAA